MLSDGFIGESFTGSTSNGGKKKTFFCHKNVGTNPYSVHIKRFSDSLAKMNIFSGSGAS